MRCCQTDCWGTPDSCLLQTQTPQPSPRHYPFPREGSVREGKSMTRGTFLDNSLRVGLSCASWSWATKCQRNISAANDVHVALLHCHTPKVSAGLQTRLYAGRVLVTMRRERRSEPVAMAATHRPNQIDSRKDTHDQRPHSFQS